MPGARAGREHRRHAQHRTRRSRLRARRRRRRRRRLARRRGVGSRPPRLEPRRRPAPRARRAARRRRRRRRDRRLRPQPTASRSPPRARATTPARSPRSRTRSSSRRSGCAASRSTPRRRPPASQAGTLWIEVTEASSPHGLFPLSGSSPDVGVVGYTLGGGLSWLARKHGLAANNVTAIEVVTPDGELVRATADEHADLFWALRGGGGNFGVVTALEFRLFPYGEVYAGMMICPVRARRRGAARVARLDAAPRPRRSRPRCGSCTSRRSPRCRSSCAAARSP